jgi:hypothetical protein
MSVVINHHTTQMGRNFNVPRALEAHSIFAIPAPAPVLLATKETMIENLIKQSLNQVMIDADVLQPNATNDNIINTHFPGIDLLTGVDLNDNPANNFLPIVINRIPLYGLPHGIGAHAHGAHRCPPAAIKVNDLFERMLRRFYKNIINPNLIIGQQPTPELQAQVQQDSALLLRRIKLLVGKFINPPLKSVNDHVRDIKVSGN